MNFLLDCQNTFELSSPLVEILVEFHREIEHSPIPHDFGCACRRQGEEAQSKDKQLESGVPLIIAEANKYSRHCDENARQYASVPNSIWAAELNQQVSHCQRQQDRSTQDIVLLVPVHEFIPCTYHDSL